MWWRKRRGPSPAAGTSFDGLRFSVNDWHAENKALNHGGKPPPCPNCQRTGFYSPRSGDGQPRYYRACKFCGLWQKAGKKPRKTIRYECHDEVLWKAPTEGWECPTCGRRFEPDTCAAWPIDNPKHVWWNVPQNLGQSEYLAYWRLEWGYDAQPFGIL